MDDKRAAAIEELVRGLSQRVARIEEKLGLSTVPPAAALESKPDNKLSPKQDIPATVSSAPQGGRWLGAVGILFFILAASFFVKLAIDSGWLTPRRQLGGLVVFGLALMLCGVRLRQRDAQYASLLPAAGLVVLFMAAYAGHLYFYLYGYGVAIALACILSVFALALFGYFKHEFFLVASICGTYSVPLLVSQLRVDSNQLRAYFLVWDLLYAVAAIQLGRRGMISLSAYFAIAISAFVFWGGPNTPSHPEIWGEVWFETIQFLLLAGALVAFSVLRKSALTSGEAWGLLPVLTIFYVAQYCAFEKLLPDLAPWISLGFASVLFGFYSFARARLGESSLASAAMVAFSILLICVHAIYLELLPKDLTALFPLALVLGGICFAKRFPYAIFWQCYFVVVAVFGLEYLGLFETAGSASHGIDRLALQLVYGAVIFGAYVVNARYRTLLILSFALAQALSALQNIAGRAFELPVDRFVTSSLWAVLALAALLWSAKVKDQILAKASIGIFAIVAFKVLFSDISSSGAGVRIVSLIVIGALLYSGGLLVRRINSWGGKSA